MHEYNTFIKMIARNFHLSFAFRFKSSLGPSRLPELVVRIFASCVLFTKPALLLARASPLTPFAFDPAAT
ncbi:hypothetical protein I7I48_09217 [Histoplasma ohiense]|nr:hypothetical protein I7I48_09217 [Histoplasma ohiense (nom. inval.)]